MDGFDTLRKRIQDVSESTAQSLISNAKQEREAILTEARREASQIEAEHDERIARAKQEREVQQKAITRLEKRRNRLKVKQSLLKEATDRALAELKAYEPEKKKDLYAGWLKQAEVTDETIYIDRKDASWFPKFLAEAYPELKAEESTDVDGGFMLRKDRTWQDYRFDSIFQQRETKLLQIAAEVLFPDTEKEDASDA